MSMSMAITKSVTIGGKTFSEKQAVEGDGGLVVEKSVPAAAAGSLTTRTDDTNGTLTLLVGHGVTTGAELHIFWTDAGVQKRAVCPVVGTVSGLSVPIPSCTGDALPADESEVTVMVPLVEAFNVAGDDIVGLVMFSESSFGTIILENDLTRHFDLASQVYVWYEGDGDANPVAGDAITAVRFSHGETTAKTMRVSVAYN